MQPELKIFETGKINDVNSGCPNGTDGSYLRTTIFCTIPGSRKKVGRRCGLVRHALRCTREVEGLEEVTFSSNMINLFRSFETIVNKS